MGRQAQKRHQRQSEAVEENGAESPSYAAQASKNEQLSARSPNKLSVPVTTNTYNVVMEFYKTGGTAQIVREFISNSIDSDCSSIKFAPLPYPAHKAGFAVIDNGHGMSRPGNLVRFSDPL